jgi:hypothetical protein
MATIPELPPHLREVPEDRVAWFRWREDILAFRVWARREADANEDFRRDLLATCARDYAFAMVVFGLLLEPRNVRDFNVINGKPRAFIRQKGWYPWVPFGFQVEVIREIEAALHNEEQFLIDDEDDQEWNDDEIEESGKGDIFGEKSRDMGLTWAFCFYAAMDFLFNDDTIIGMYSYKEDLVISDTPQSMFYKVRAQIGANEKVPRLCHAPGTIFHGIPIAVPAWLKPPGWNPMEHDRRQTISHSVKTNQITGEATTTRSGVATRASYTILDEVAKHDKFGNMWSNQTAVTDHRFAITTPDRTAGDDAFILAKQARDAARNPRIPGPRLISLPWWRHPLRDASWEKRQRARHADNPQKFAREYELDWNAGLGAWVYPAAKLLEPDQAPYVPGVGEVYCMIDPAITDPTAVVWVQRIPGETPQHRVVEALVLKTPSAEYLAPILMGWPFGHEMRNGYNQQAIQEVMDFTWELRSNGIMVNYVGDPYGESKQGASSLTYYESLGLTAERLHAENLDLNVPLHDILVATKYDEKSRYHMARKEKLNVKLRDIVFHDHPRTRYILRALQEYRYMERDDNRQYASEAQEPAHDWCSHPVSAMEYWAVNTTILDLFGDVPLQEPVVPNFGPQAWNSAGPFAVVR